MSEHEYKVGDVVEVVKDDSGRFTGRCGIVGRINPGALYPFIVNLGGEVDVFAGHELKLATPPPPSTGEVRTTSTSGAEKGTKPERFDLLPVEALAAVARHYGVGAAKYDDHNWRKGYEWSKSYSALQRHANAFWGGEDMDAETGSPHMAAVAFHALTLLTYMEEQRSFDDRWKGAAA